MGVLKSRVGALAALALACLSPALAAAEPLPTPETFTLRNGMEVVVIPDHRAPVVTHMVWYRVGSSDEPYGQSGIAHFFEHLMFKGTDDIPQGEFSRTVQRNGGQLNAFTSYDYTAYYERIARDRLDMVMRMEADRMRNLNLPPELIASERDVVIEERRMRTDNNPNSVLYERMRAMLYPHSPYGTPVIGWLHEIQDLEHDEALDFYRTWYAPNNAILVVAGDVTAEELRPLAQRYYGRLRPTRDLPERVWPQDPPPRGPERIVHSDPKVRQPSLSRLYPSISYGTAEGLRPHALDVAMEILGGSETSWLYRALVEEQRIAVSAGAYASTSGIAGGNVGFYATPAEGHTLEEVEAAMDEVIARFLEEGPSQAELERTRAKLAAQAVYARDSQATMARIFGASLAQGETIERIVSWPDDIEAVTLEDVMDIARETLDINASVTGELLPEEGTQ